MHDGGIRSTSSRVAGTVARVQARHLPPKTPEGLAALVSARTSRRRGPGGASFSVSHDMSAQSIIGLTVSNCDLSDWLVDGIKFVSHVHNTTEYSYFDQIAAAYVLLEASHGFCDDNVSDLPYHCSDSLSLLLRNG
jgi:hypothetical protein